MTANAHGSPIGVKPPSTSEHAQTDAQHPVLIRFGDTFPASKTGPMAAIKAKCLQCVDGHYKEVEKCLSTPSNSQVCRLHQFLAGKRVGRGGRWPGALKAIRRECRLCMNNSPDLIARCTSQGCPLWQYRFGLRPATARKRGLNVGP